MAPAPKPFPLLAALLAACLAACLAIGACSSAGRCRRGSEGCRATTSGECAQGLVKDAGNCVLGSAGSGGGGSGGSGGTGGTGGTGGGDPDGGPPSECAGDDLATACALFCDAFCANQETFCVASRCAPGDCAEGGSLMDTCLSQCASDGPACAERACETELARTCEDFAIRMNAADTSEPYQSLCADSDPKCVHHDEARCSLTCGSVESADGLGVGGDLSSNGVCDDGSDGSTPSCARGTDCDDCGTQECAVAGETCATHEDCCGYLSPGAFCVNVSGTPTCLSSCTETRTCPTGFECTAVDNNVDFVCAPN